MPTELEIADLEIADTVYEEIKEQGLERVEFKETLTDMIDSASDPIARDLEQPDAALDRAYDAAVEAAEDGDYDTALLRFRNALGVEAWYDKTASQVTDEHVERQTVKSLLGGHTTAELKAANLERRIEIEHSSKPELPRHMRRRLKKGRG